MKKFHTVLLDPPWPERGGGKIKRGADRHYPTLKPREMVPVIKGCPFWDGIEDNAHMYMFATNNYLPDALWLMGELGFTYVTKLSWIKTVPEERWNKKRYKEFMKLAVEEGIDYAVMRMVIRHGGMGQYFRGQDEILLFGRRGKGKHEDVFNKNPEMFGRKLLTTTFLAPATPRHSEKPQLTFDIIEQRSKGPYLELFARESGREGWVQWGNEVTSWHSELEEETGEVSQPEGEE